MKNVIKCYAAAYSDRGMIRYYFNRMPDGEPVNDTASFSRDPSIDSALSQGQKDELKGMLCSFMSRDRTCSLKYNELCRRVGTNGYCLEFDLVIETRII